MNECVLKNYYLLVYYRINTKFCDIYDIIFVMIDFKITITIKLLITGTTLYRLKSREEKFESSLKEKTNVRPKQAFIY